MKSRIVTTVLAILFAINHCYSQDIGYDGSSINFYLILPGETPHMGLLGIDDYILDNSLFPGSSFELTEVRIAMRIVAAGDFAVEFFDTSDNFITSVTLNYSGAVPVNSFVTAIVDPPVVLPTAGRVHLLGATAAGQSLFSGNPPVVGINEGAFGHTLGNPLDDILVGDPNGFEDGYLTFRLTGTPFVEPIPVPALGEWGLIFLVLVTLTFGVVMMRVRQGQLALSGMLSAESSGQYSVGALLRSLPFDAKGYGRVLMITFAFVVLGFAVAIMAFGYSLTGADIPGMLVCVPVLSYLGYLLKG